MVLMQRIYRRILKHAPLDPGAGPPRAQQEMLAASRCELGEGPPDTWAAFIAMGPPSR